MKKIFWLAVLFAQTIEAKTTLPDPNFSGFYAGAMIGVNQFLTNTISNQTLLFNSVFGSSAEIDNAYTGNALNYHTIGAFYVGYGDFIQHTPWYLGVEGFLSLSIKDKSISHSTTMLSTATTYGFEAQESNSITSTPNTQLATPEFALDLKPGVKIDSADMLYARVGMAFNQIQLSEQDTLRAYNSVIPELDTFINTYQSQKYSQIGLRLGFGLERIIFNHFALTFDYIYTGYRQCELVGSNIQSINDSSGQLIYTASVNRNFYSTPYSNALLLGLKFHA